MAGTTIAMSKLKQVLRWKEEGYSNRKIAQLVGLNKETVNNYISRAKADSLSQKELLQLDDYVLDIRLRGGIVLLESILILTTFSCIINIWIFDTKFI
jgi:DNA-binding transcriptional MerR regulator